MEETLKSKMLEYCKTILLKISFNRKLFRKEYRKTFLYLKNPREQQALKQWLRQNLVLNASKTL